MATKRVYANQKGGVTKTTTAVMDMVQSRLLNKRSLLVDTDPQGNGGYELGYHPDTLEHTIYTVMMGTSTLEQALLPTYFNPQTGGFFDPRSKRSMENAGITSLDQARRGPDLLPNNLLASSADSELQNHPSWGTLLRDILETCEGNYDDIGIDTNPSLGKLTVLAFCAADYAIIPLVPETLPLQGMIKLCQTFIEARKYNRKLKMAGIVFTRVRYASHTRAMKNVKELILDKLNADKNLPELHLTCFDATIPESALFEDSLEERKNVLLAYPASAPSVAYWGFQAELLQKIQSGGADQARKKYEQLQSIQQQQRADEKSKRLQGTKQPLLSE